MSENPFEACWHRWDRADEHRRALTSLWNEYIADHPFDYSLDHAGDGTYILRVWQQRQMPAAMSVVMGEWLYNLRAALDYTMWATAAYVACEVPPPGEAVLQYPIYDDPAAWQRNLYRLRGLTEGHRKLLETMQPFNSDADANFLGWINRLARIDRHRRLVDGTACISQLEPVFAVPEGSTMKLEWGERVLVGGRADVARLRVEPYVEGMRIDFNPRVGIDPEIAEWSESPFWKGKHFGERLVMLQIFVAGEIAVYEYDCTGSSRKQDLLTDSYRAESDARQRASTLAHRKRPEVDWKAAGKARRSSRSRLRGDDFPSGAQPLS